jgi:rod shape-determining protein MreD
MRGLKFAGGLAVVLLLHLVGVRLAPGFFLVCDLFLLLTVFHALDGKTLPGLFGGLGAGLVTDLVTGGLFGLFGLVDTIIGYGTAYAVQRLVIQRARGAMILFVLAALTQQALLAGLVLLLMPNPQLPDPIWVAAKAGAVGLLGLGLFLAKGRLKGWVEKRRTGRTSRLRFGR